MSENHRLSGDNDQLRADADSVREERDAAVQRARQAKVDVADVRAKAFEQIREETDRLKVQTETAQQMIATRAKERQVQKTNTILTTAKVHSKNCAKTDFPA